MKGSGIKTRLKSKRFIRITRLNFTFSCEWLKKDVLCL